MIEVTANGHSYTFTDAAAFLMFTAACATHVGGFTATACHPECVIPTSVILQMVGFKLLKGIELNDVEQRMLTAFERNDFLSIHSTDH